MDGNNKLKRCKDQVVKCQLNSIANFQKVNALSKVSNPSLTISKNIFESLNTVQKKMNEFKVPFDWRQIPGKANCRDSFSNFTVNQW